MASFDYNPETGKARFFFRFRRKQYNKTWPMESERHASRELSLIEETLEDLERGKATIPPGSDVAAFIMTGGKVSSAIHLSQIEPLPETKSPTLGEVFDTYHDTLTVGSKEASSIETEKIHVRHFRRLLGEKLRFESMTVGTIQKYVNSRANEGVVRDTIKKELVTLRVVWSWAHKREHVASPLSWSMADLTLPKAHEKAPFQTWDQIVRRIERDKLSGRRADELWECLWLDQAQTVECLAWAKEHAARPFLYPMIAFAAYVGARRSEIARSERDDWDLAAGVVAIRQKKADKSKSFTRRSVPIHPDLAEVMDNWFQNHPGGPWTFADEDGSPIDPHVASGYLRRLLRGGKWSVIHGWHTFRHSLASNMASSATDQRIINEILGHHTAEMERRYRHLLPHKQASALHSLFRPTCNT